MQPITNKILISAQPVLFYTTVVSDLYLEGMRVVLRYREGHEEHEEDTKTTTLCSLGILRVLRDPFLRQQENGHSRIPYFQRQ